MAFAVVWRSSVRPLLCPQGGSAVLLKTVVQDRLGSTGGGQGKLRCLGGGGVCQPALFRAGMSPSLLVPVHVPPGVREGVEGKEKG